MTGTTQNKTVGAWFTGLLFPVAGFIYALFHPTSKNYKTLFVLFFTFLGIAFLFQEEQGDVIRYIFDFYAARAKRGIGLFEYFQSRPDKQQIDYYSSFMLWFVSRFTGDYRLFLGILALVYSLFFAANIQYVVSRIRVNGFSVFLLILLVFTPKMMMLTHRWWAALQVFLFGALPIIFEKKYIKLFWCFAAAFVFHFSFLYPLILLLLSFILPKKTLWPYLLLFVVTSGLTSFDFNFITPYIEVLFSDKVAGRTTAYINYETLEHNFFSQTGKYVMNIANVVLSLTIYFSSRENIKNNKILRCLYVATLLIGSFAMLASLTEWGWRYLDLSYMLFVIFYLVYLSEEINYKRSIQLFRLVSPLFLYFIFFQIRGVLCIIGPSQFFLGNYITTWFLQDVISVFDFIKQLF